jgi:chemotaxis family two-component system response regulator Rcp1
MKLSSKDSSYFDEQSIDRFIGNKLKKQRMRCNLSQSSLAKAVGCSYQLIQKQEAGEARVQASSLYKISKILNVTPNYFYEGYKTNDEDELNLPLKGDLISSRVKKSWNILLVEDNPEDEFLFRKVFENISLQYNFDIHTCYDGVEALKYLRDCNSLEGTLPDIIFVDLNIPKKDGFSLIKDIKHDASLLYIPTVVITNSVNAEEMLNCYKLYASGYICKSFDVNKFKEKIESVLLYWTSVVATPKNY